MPAAQTRSGRRKRNNILMSMTKTNGDDQMKTVTMASPDWGGGGGALVIWTLLGVCSSQGSLFEPRFLSQGCIFGKNSLAKGIFFIRSPLPRVYFWRKPPKIGISGAELASIFGKILLEREYLGWSSLKSWKNGLIDQEILLSQGYVFDQNFLSQGIRSKTAATHPRQKNLGVSPHRWHWRWWPQRRRWWWQWRRCWWRRRHHLHRWRHQSDETTTVTPTTPPATTTMMYLTETFHSLSWPVVLEAFLSHGEPSPDHVDAEPGQFSLENGS